MDSKTGQLDMSDTATQLATLKNMHAKGVTSLEQGGEKIAFASGKELRQRIAYLEAELAKEANGGKAPSRFTYPAYDKRL